MSCDKTNKPKMISSEKMKQNVLLEKMKMKREVENYKEEESRSENFGNLEIDESSSQTGGAHTSCLKRPLSDDNRDADADDKNGLETDLMSEITKRIKKSQVVVESEY